jgi:O-antigen ligase
MIYATLSLSTLIKYVFFRLHADIIYKHRRLIIAVVAAILLFESAIAIIQFMNGSPFARSVESQKHLEIFGGGATDEINFVFRPLGTFGHANYLAAFIALTAPVVLALGILKRKKVYFVVYGLSLVTSILTLSRSGWVALVPHVAIFYSDIVKTFKQALSKIKRVVKVSMLISVLILCLIVILPRLIKSLDVNLSDLNNGVGMRVSQMENATKLISLHPLFGVGLGMNVIEGYNLEPSGVMWGFPSPIHNIFALILVENGIPAFALYILIIGYILLLQYRAIILRGREENIITRGLFSGIIGVCIVGLVQPYDFLGPILLLSLLYIQ